MPISTATYSTTRFIIAAVILTAGAFILLPVTGCSVAPSPSHATDAQIAQWESTVLERSQRECRRVLWQIEGETLNDAIAIYERGYLPDDCLAILPTGEVVQGIPYGALYIGFGRTFGTNSDSPNAEDDDSENTCGVNFSGPCITYISDTPRQIL